MAGTTWPTLSDGRKFKASEVEAKFDWLEGSIVPQAGGLLADNTYDLGYTAAAWNIGHINSWHCSQAILSPTGASLTVALQSATTLSMVGPASANIPTFALDGDDVSIYGSSSTLALNIGTGAAVTLRNGAAVDEFSTDITFAGDSDLAVPTERAALYYISNRLNIAVTTTASNLMFVPSQFPDVGASFGALGIASTITSVEISITTGHVYLADGMYTVRWQNAALRTLRTSLYFQLMDGATTVSSQYVWWGWDRPVVTTKTVYDVAKSAFRFTAATTTTMRIVMTRAYANELGSTMSYALKVGRIA